MQPLKVSGTSFRQERFSRRLLNTFATVSISAQVPRNKSVCLEKHSRRKGPVLHTCWKTSLMNILELGPLIAQGRTVALGRRFARLHVQVHPAGALDTQHCAWLLMTSFCSKLAQQLQSDSDAAHLRNVSSTPCSLSFKFMGTRHAARLEPHCIHRTVSSSSPLQEEGFRSC
jgi:hypothetical protein